MKETIFQSIALLFSNRGIQTFFVGGCVRDLILGQESDDIDICLVGVTDKSVVVEILSQFTSDIAEEVGNTFPVWIANLPTVGKTDFALARSERKTGDNHRDFVCDVQNVSIVDDLVRRDLTINAIAMDVLTGQIVDPFGGKAHLAARIAHPVSEAFAEDPLRVLRAARFISRFNLVPTASLKDMCRKLSFQHISGERIGQELKKVLTQGVSFSSFFRFLNEVDWTGILAETNGNLFFRPINVTTVTGRLVDMVLTMGDAAFTSMTTRISFMDKSFVRKVIALSKIVNSTTRRFVRQVIVSQIPLEMLNEEVCPCAISEVEQLLNDGSMNPIVTGNTLIQLGMRPGKEMKVILDRCLAFQDDGILNTDNWSTFVTM